MLQALLHGKLSREQENMEDVLVSNVFGLLRYIPPQDGLLPLLARAEAIDVEDDEDRFPLSTLNEVDQATGAIAEFDFWPFWNEPECISCEPDVVIRIRDGRGRRLIVLIEAKFTSGKSSEANTLDERPNDQLAREWDNLVRIARRGQAEPFLIYMTASIGVPAPEIEASVAEYLAKRPGDSQKPRMLALSWRHIPEVFGSADHTILRDLCDLAKRMGLTYFHGVKVCGVPDAWTEVPHLGWRFTP